MLMGQYDILVSDYQHQTPQYYHRKKYKLVDYCKSMLHKKWVQTVHLVGPTATEECISTCTKCVPRNHLQALDKLPTCRMQSIFVASYIANCVSWTDCEIAQISAVESIQRLLGSVSSSIRVTSRISLFQKGGNRIFVLTLSSDSHFGP